MGETNAVDRVLRYSSETGTRRGQEGRWVAGVCLGLGRRWNVDPVLFRVGFLLLTVFAGIGAAAYLICWLMLPSADSSIPLDRALRRGDGGAITLLVITTIAVLGSFSPAWEGRPVSVVGLLVFAAIVWFVVRHSRTTAPVVAAPVPAPVATDQQNPTTPTAGPAESSVTAGQGGAHAAPGVVWARPGTTDSLSMPVVAVQQPAGVTGHPGPTASAGASGLPQAIPVSPPSAPRLARRRSWLASLLIAGLAILAYLGVDALPLPDGDAAWMLPLSASLVVLGGGLAAAAAARRRPPLVTLAAILVGLSLVSSLMTGGSETHSEPAAFWSPTTPAEIRSSYGTAAGNSVLDLTAVPVGPQVRSISVDQGAGRVEVRLPAGASAKVTTDIGVGTFVVEQHGQTQEITDGAGVRSPATTVGNGPLAYDIRIQTGVGEVAVVVTDTPARGQETL